VSVDETMIGFKGRLGFIQYMPKKPTKWGLKAFVLSDAHTGYMYSWHLYTGMSNNNTTNKSCIHGYVIRTQPVKRRDNTDIICNAQNQEPISAVKWCQGASNYGNL